MMYKTKLGLDTKCMHCGKLPHEHQTFMGECRKPYTAPKLRKLDPRCVALWRERVEAHGDQNLHHTKRETHVPDCECEK